MSITRFWAVYTGQVSKLEIGGDVVLILENGDEQIPIRGIFNQACRIFESNADIWLSWKSQREMRGADIRRVADTSIVELTTMIGRHVTIIIKGNQVLW